MKASILRTWRAVAEHLGLTLLLLLAAAAFVQYDVLWRWDKLLYDAQLSMWHRPVSDNIVIIAVDDDSLNRLGHWPWPRSLHARLLKRLQREAPRAIGLDILFSEADATHPAADQALAQAISASGNVVLPVYLSQSSPHAVPVEALPLPLFTRAAAALGHVNLDLDEDGIARRIFLREGIGKPHWLHYSLALLEVAGEPSPLQQSIERAMQSARDDDYSPMLWSRRFPYLIPYAGPPEHFTRIGYAQVLAGEYPQNLFRDKIVLIGATAPGLGDAFPTPLSGQGGTMSGVEIIANIVDALQHHVFIRPINKPWLTVITLVLIALPLLAYPYLKPATTLLLLFGTIGATLLLFALLLWLAGIWLPLSTILLFQLLGYPLWSWRRLDLAMRQINKELAKLLDLQQSMRLSRHRRIEHEIAFIRLFTPIKAWVLQDLHGQTISGEGVTPRCNFNHLTDKNWRFDGHRLWAQVNYHQQTCRLGLSLAQDTQLDEHKLSLLNHLLTQDFDDNNQQKAIAEDRLQAKTRQLQAAGREYQQLRRIIDDSLAGMADGVLICDARGQILLSNHRAAWYLCGDDDARINEQPLPTLLDDIELKQGDLWSELLQSVLFRQQRVLARARHRSGRDLMIEVSPLTLIENAQTGFIINLSDISLLKNSERKRNQVLDFLSHDLRAPLSSMLAMIELARSKSSLSEMRAMSIPRCIWRNSFYSYHAPAQMKTCISTMSISTISYSTPSISYGRCRTGNRFASNRCSSMRSAGPRPKATCSNALSSTCCRTRSNTARKTAKSRYGFPAANRK